MSIRILLVDDHQMMLEGLRLMIQREKDLEVVGVATNGKAAIENSLKLSPNLIIMDIQLKELDGIDISQRILSQSPQVKIVILSALADTDLVNRAMQAGIHGYLLKASAMEDLTRTIRCVMAGNTYLCPEATNALVHNYRALLAEKKAPEKPVFSEREREVLKLTAEGLRVKEIADKLNISIKTVETHRSHLMTKLECASVVDLTRFAIREGIVSL